MTNLREIRHFHFFAGLGGAARGANRAKAVLGSLEARFRCIGGIDNDLAAVRDFERLAGVPGTLLDLFTLEQYQAVHGHLPPPGWREATRADIHRAAGHERPHIVLFSAPCVGFSGLLSDKLSQSPKYQALNQLALRGLHLALDAWADDPPEFFLWENVPRVQTRGRHLLDQIEQLLSHYGYASAETTHDCGELGNLAQSRKRFLLVARHTEKVPPFLYEPVKRPLRAVGRVLEALPMPGDIETAGPMHRIPALHWKTWVRLAFVEAGSDWRSLQKLAVENGYLKDYAIESAPFRDAYGVRTWDEPTGTVTADARPSKGAFSVADPRIEGHDKSVQLGVRRWDQAAPTVTGGMAAGHGPNSVADPRVSAGPSGERYANSYRVTAWGDIAGTVTTGQSPSCGSSSVADPRMPREKPFRNVFRVVRWDEVSRAVTGGGHPTAGGISVADPRVGYGPSSQYNKLAITDWERPAKTVTGANQPQRGALSVADPRISRKVFSGHGVTDWNDPSRTIAGESFPSNGAFAVADPRPGLVRPDGSLFESAGHYGVVPWNEPSGTVTAGLSYDRGRGSVADPRLPAPDDKLTCIIESSDHTWHRPFTTFELAALQGLVDPAERFELDGQSDSAWRMRIGNAIPSPAAEAIFGVIGTTLLLAWSGETFVLGSTPIWVRDIAVAIAVARQEVES